MASIEDDAKKLAEYARAGAPPKPVRLVPRQPATVTPLPPTPTLQDEIERGLVQILADIRAGKVKPSHLFLCYGEETEGELACPWFSVGLNRYELIGHLTTYAATLAVCEDE